MFSREMQHAESPSCLRFSFTRNKLEKSRKPSSSASACLCHDWNGSRGNPCQSWYVPPRKEYCFRQNDFIGEMQCSRPKLVNGSENRCSFIFDKKYDELRWFRLTRVTTYGMNVFR